MRENSRLGTHLDMHIECSYYPVCGGEVGEPDMLQAWSSH